MHEVNAQSEVGGGDLRLLAARGVVGLNLDLGKNTGATQLHKRAHPREVGQKNCVNGRLR